MLNAEAWFPPAGTLPSGLPPGVSSEADAISATVASPATISGQLPVGLGSPTASFDKVFVDTFTEIAINGQPIPATLAKQAATLQSVLNAAGAPCWKPDPPSPGTCKVA
jgi:multiple sugar transport system substrate-binding protein